jgi:cellobiose phosphorylase
MNFETSKIYPGIPEYFNGEGRGLYHYLTGAASWLMLTVITEMFGVKGSLGALYLNPKLVKEQFDDNGKAEISLTFGKRAWHIIYANPNHLEYGEYKISTMYLDGKQLDIRNQSAVISIERIKQLDKRATHEIVIALE